MLKAGSTVKFDFHFHAVGEEMSAQSQVAFVLYPKGYVPKRILYTRQLGGPQEPVPEETTVQERPNGPLFVRGNVRIFGQDHTLVRQDTRAALCRCGASANKPFCDGSHRRVGFRTTRGPA